MLLCPSLNLGLCDSAENPEDGLLLLPVDPTDDDDTTSASSFLDFISFD
jgi:hypothetical protein